jgi:hypothetical protein
MKIKGGLILLSFIFSCFSCDNSEPFVIDGQKVYTLNNQCGTIVVRGSSFSASIMVACAFNGNYHVNTDSLKIKAFSNKDVVTTIHFQMNNKEFTGKDIETKGGETLSFNFRLLPSVPYQKTTGTILLLPSNFITCEGKPIITDTIQIQLKN